MTRFKRSLAASGPPQLATTAKRATPLHEGFAIGGPLALPAVPDRLPASAGRQGEPMAYGRGSAELAMAAAEDPQRCVEALCEDGTAQSSRGPFNSRKNLWEQLGRKMGFQNPFHLEPQLIFAVTGALKRAGYRSGQLYLDTAKAVHVANGNAWTEQLAQARRFAIRSLKRGLGSPKQAGGLPMSRLAQLKNSREPIAPEGPLWPVRSTLLASWWLLREIEASRAKTEHVVLDHANHKVTWRLPSSKTDQTALGAYRSHRCACGIGPRALCPYHLMADHFDAMVEEQTWIFTSENGEPPSKQGWADTFQELARMLGIPITHPNGARAFTGHSARVSGARHLASTQVELWRVQLYGRWGSNVFVHYIQDAPLAQLDSLALESSASLSIQEAKLQLQDLLRQVENLKQPPVAPMTLDMLEDCEAAVGLVEDPSLPEVTKLVLNTNVKGKLHRLLAASPENHPKWWKTKCGWRFGQDHTEFEWVDEDSHTFAAATKCGKCFPNPKVSNSSSSSSTSSDTSTDA